MADPAAILPGSRPDYFLVIGSMPSRSPEPEMPGDRSAKDAALDLPPTSPRASSRPCRASGSIASEAINGKKFSINGVNP